MRAIEVAQREGDWRRVAKEAHAIVGTSGLFGLAEVVRSAKQVEVEVKDTHHVSTERLIELRGHLAQAREALQCRIHQWQSAAAPKHVQKTTALQVG